MGKCEDCIFYDYEGVDYNRDCYVKHWCGKFKMKVDPNATCNKFIKKDTPDNSGYTGGSGGGCFLTSACVEYLGKPDDCEELTVLRSFRDNYMKKTEEGAALVKEYYAVAPVIVEKINSSQDKGSYYSYIDKIINECVVLIKEGNNSVALEKYKQMVLYLKKEFDI